MVQYSEYSTYPFLTNFGFVLLKISEEGGGGARERVELARCGICSDAIFLVTCRSRTIVNLAFIYVILIHCSSITQYIMIMTYLVVGSTDCINVDFRYAGGA